MVHNGSNRIHPAARMYAAEVCRRTMGRREFLSRSTALGVSAVASYGLIGLAPTFAANDAVEGGTLRIQMEVIALKDPRLWDWSEIANFCRGWLEYLVEYGADGTFRPMLLSSWSVNDDATQYRLNVRPGVTWNNGEPFTAEDVAHNIRRWCNAKVVGNSMASRMQRLIDPETNQLREGAVEIVDDLTLDLMLSAPDAALVASFSDYPAAIVHQSYEGEDPALNPVGTGPYLPELFETGVRARLVRNDNHVWWGREVYGGATLERIEYVDYGTDPAKWLAAIDGGEVDMVYESLGQFIEVMDGLDLVRSEVVTANTIVIRANQMSEAEGARPYSDARVRRALALACNNDVLLELGYDNRGLRGENHHVCPVHPDYAEVARARHDPDEAFTLLDQAGMLEFEHELVSLDDGYQRATCDVVAAQLHDAGIKVRRTILPRSVYRENWRNFPFSATEWGHRPLGVQVLTLAYRSGAVWNETGFSNAVFDELLDRANAIVDAGERSEIMARLETILQDEGVMIQPYWRSSVRHFRQNVVGAEMHPAAELYPYKLGLSG